MDEPIPDLSFAQLVPSNERARKAFADAIRTAQAQSDEHQLRFYKENDSSNLTASVTAESATVESSSAQSDTGESEPAERPVVGLDAYANLSLSPSDRPKYPRIGWRVGRGSRNVDIRIISSENESIGRLGTVEFRLFIHPRSGLLCLQSSGRGRPVMYADAAQKLITLDPSETLVLLQPITRIFLGDYEFQLQYTLSREHERRFFKTLDEFMTEFYNTSIHRAGQIYPSTKLPSFCGKYWVGGHLGDGTFGDVRYGVDRESGEPVALKDIRLQDSRWRQDTLNEIALLEELKHLPHCLHLLAAWCEEHDLHPKNCPSRNREHFYLATDLALFDFSDPVLMTELPFSKTIELSRHILLGIQSLHELGIMHRDISRKNSLVICIEPAKAVVGDFGKAVRASRHTSTGIGPIPTCAPEVWTRNYTTAIDLWSWAYMMAECLGYRIAKADYTKQISKQRLAQIRSFLQDRAAKDPQVALMVELLNDVLIWEPHKRLTVEQALSHPVWGELNEIPARSWDVNDLFPSKKQKSEETIDGDHGSDSVKTVPFSEEP